MTATHEAGDVITPTNAAADHTSPGDSADGLADRASLSPFLPWA
jgi:hypothetical protein